MSTNPAPPLPQRPGEDTDPPGGLTPLWVPLGIVAGAFAAWAVWHELLFLVAVLFDYRRSG